MKKNNQLPDWNRDKSWDKIEQRLEKKKRRFLPFWWIFGGSTVVALIAGLFIFGLGGNELGDQKVSESVDQLINQDSREADELRIDSKINNINKTDEQPILNEAITGNIENTNFNKTIESKTEEKHTTLRYRETNLNSKLSYSDNQKNIMSLAGISIPIDTDKLPRVEKENQADKNVLVDPLLNSLEAILIWKNEQFNLPTQMSVETPVVEKEQPKSKGNWLWLTESGFDFGKVNHTGENDYANRKSTTEEFRFTSTSTLGFEKEFSKNWYLKSGLTFQTFFEKYDGTSISTNEADVFRDSAFYYELNNNQIYYEPGIVSETTTYSRQIVKNNFLYRLSLPISFGKKFNFGKMQLAADLGVKPQFYQHFSGIVADEDYLHLFDNQIINSTYYSNDFDLGLLANLSARYSLTASTQVGLGVRYEKEDFLNLRKENFMSHYEMIGGYLGVYRNF